MTDRKLGSGVSGRVFMVIDRHRQCQMACKIVQLRKCHSIFARPVQKSMRSKEQTAKLWREVDILKEMSHVSYSKAMADVPLIHDQPNIIMIDRVFHTDFNIEIHGVNRLVRQSGYTKAVDMWSVGCVTAALLNGRPAFATSQIAEGQEESAAAVIAAAGKCNLGELDDAKIWGGIDPEGKDFIRQVLVRDEKARLTANQGLLHKWFTQQSDGELIVRRYERAIAEWKPNYPGWDFKEDLERYIKFRIPDSDVGLISPIAEVGTDSWAATETL
ncbi:MAG: hypothetical protein Q9223_003551 [Gallowayella weberi]